MGLNKVFILAGSSVLALATLCQAGFAENHLLGLGSEQNPMVAYINEGDPLSIELQGGPFNANILDTCKYDHFARGRMHYWFNISWGDGTYSNLQSGPDGESCAEIGHHTYTKPGTYQIEVYIGSLGNADQPVPMFSGGTVANIIE